MKIQRTQNGYTANVGVGHGVTRVYFIGFGETRNEAMDKCFTKLNRFLTK